MGSTADQVHSSTGRLLAEHPCVVRFIGPIVVGVGFYRIAKDVTHDVGDELECAR